MKETVLTIRNLALIYATRKGDVNAVRDVSLEVRQGEALGLVGESGCGKSTVAYAAMGYLERNARIVRGEVLLRAENLLTMTPRQLESIRGKHVAMIYQDPMTTLNPSYRIGEQLIEVLTQHESLSRDQARVRSLEMLNKVNMPDSEVVMDRFPHQLSGGQQQRVVIAMAMLCSPTLLVMDEPTTALDVTVEAAILDHLRLLRSELDSSILYISHNLGVIARFCDRVAVMYAGELVETAPVNDIFVEPMHPYTRGLIGCVPSVGASKDIQCLHTIPGQVWPAQLQPPGCIFEPRCSYAEERCQKVHPELEALPDGRSVRCLRWREICAESACATPEPESRWAPTAVDDEGCSPQAGALLTVKNLKTYYTQRARALRRSTGRGRIKAVDGVSFTMDTHSIVGVVGESGCGKSSLARTIAGLVVPTEGSMEFLGVDITKVVERRDRRVVRELQMIFQNPDSSLNPTKNIRQIISRPLRVARDVRPDQIDQEVARLLNAVNLNESYLERKPNQLSGGEKQRVAIARALAGRPELLVCDEPVSALDVSVQCSVLNTLLDIQHDFGTSLLFISHDLNVVRYLCDTIIVMYLGKVCEIGPASMFFSPPYHPYTEALLSSVPIADPRVVQSRIHLEGSPPSALNPPTGCRFHTRCPRKVGLICETTEPPDRHPCDGYSINCHIPLDELEQMGQVLSLAGDGG